MNATSTPENGQQEHKESTATPSPAASGTNPDIDQPIDYLPAHEVARQDAYDRGYEDGRAAILDGITDPDRTLGGLYVWDDDAQTVLIRRTPGLTDEQWVYLRDVLTAEALRLGFVRVGEKR